MHLGLWVNPNDQNNRAAVFLMALGMLILCAARAAACSSHLWAVAASSYFIEFLFAACGVLLGLVHVGKGAFVAIASLLCLAAVFMGRS
jgi:hypothetical protein